jgi:hypothetical protein
VCWRTERRVWKDPTATELESGGPPRTQNMREKPEFAQALLSQVEKPEPQERTTSTLDLKPLVPHAASSFSRHWASKSWAGVWVFLVSFLVFALNLIFPWPDQGCKLRKANFSDARKARSHGLLAW